jgi:hypothetical protein
MYLFLKYCATDPPWYIDTRITLNKFYSPFVFLLYNFVWFMCSFHLTMATWPRRVIELNISYRNKVCVVQFSDEFITFIQRGCNVIESLPYFCWLCGWLCQWTRPPGTPNTPIPSFFNQLHPFINQFDFRCFALLNVIMRPVTRSH